MRQLVFAITAVAALGATALTAAPAQAQSVAHGWTLSIGGGHGAVHDDFRDQRHFARPVRDGWHGGGWRGEHRGWGGEHRGWGRPVYGGGYGHQPRCHIRKVRYWDGWGWVVDRRQVCR